MAKCHRSGVRVRVWLVFSAVEFRRKLLDTILCGVARHKTKGSACTLGSPKKPSEWRRVNGSDRLSELLKEDFSDSGSEEAEEETRRKIEVFEELQDVVRRLQWEETGDRRKEAATEVRRLAKDDAEARETIAMLGAIPPLVGMLDSDDLDSQISSLYALLNLGIGNDMNKAAIVTAGAVHKMLKLIESGYSPPVCEAIVANFLGLSALDSNKPIIGSSGATAFLVKSFESSAASGSQVRQDSLRALFNLSISPSNIPHLVESELVTRVLSLLGDMEVSKRILSILANLVSVPEGRRAVSRSTDSFSLLVDALNWTDAPGCQEKSAYILMVMAHKSPGDRTAMIAAGIMSSLLELALVGSALAQRRASRLLEILRVDKGKQVSEAGCSGVLAVSAPLCGGPSDGNDREDVGMSEERRAVRQLVQQSLQSNIKRIVRRANLPQDYAPSDHFKALTVTSSSKSLPF